MLNKREEKLLNCLWEQDKPVTISELEKMFADEKLSKATVFKAVQSLIEKGFAKVGGVEKAAKTYARKIEPAVTKAEYGTSVLREKGIDEKMLGDLVLAMLGGSGNKKTGADREAVQKLEKIINEIKGCED